MFKWFKNKKGYAQFKDSEKSVDRWAAAKKLGRPLKPREVVHHKNRIKTDNRPSNLWVFPNQKAHHTAHKKDKKRTGRW